MNDTHDNKERLSNVKAIRSQGDVVSSFTYGYNKIDNRVQMKLDHEGVLVNYGYDGVSRLTSESWNLGAAVQSCNNQYTAQPQGNESGFSNVAKATPSAGILTSPFLSYYTYDSAGNRTAKYRLDGGSSYAVDDENRLTTEQPFSVQALTPATTTTQDNWVELDFGALVAPFRLDVALPDTNRRFKIQWHDGTSYQDISSGAALGANLEQDGYYRPFSQDCRFLFVSVAMQKIRYWQETGSSAGVSLAAYTIVNGTPIAYAHDANGNMTSRMQGTSVETYAHDYANRIVTYSDQQAAYNYIFAPSGERMAKTNAGTGDSEWYMYDGDDVVADYALPSGGAYALTATYANGLGIDSKVARYDASGAASYYIPDALGSVHRILDGSQNVVNTYLTNAWGESLVSQEGVPNRYGFTQRERDSESGLMHFRARSYDPRLGRFIQRDPLGMVDGPNMFAYVKNNPVVNIDPKGLKFTLLTDLKAIPMIAVDHWFVDNFISSYLGEKYDVAKEILTTMITAKTDFGEYSLKQLEAEIDIRYDIIQGMRKFQKSGAVFVGSAAEVTVDDNRWISKYPNMIDIQSTPGSSARALDLLFSEKTRVDCFVAIQVALFWAVAQNDSSFDAKFPTLGLGGNGATCQLPMIATEQGNEDMKDIIPGDVVRFENLKSKKGLGAWHGENAIYMGKGKYSGFGIKMKSGETDVDANFIKERLVLKYNEVEQDTKKAEVLPEPYVNWRIKTP